MTSAAIPPLTAGALAAVAAGGAAGAVLRWSVDQVAPATTGFPWPTLAINVVGAFLLALLPHFTALRSRRGVTLALGPGLLGGFTTLSAYADQSRALVSSGQPALAAAYVCATVLGCVLAVALGHRLAGAWAPEEVDL